MIKILILVLSLAVCLLLGLFAYFQQVQISQSMAPIPTRGRSFTSYRDAQGVAHITGDNIFDVVYAQGYDHAQQRLFQIDTMRRLISGRMSEFIGEEGLAIDKYARTIGVEHVITNALHTLTDYQTKLLEAYAAGVNDYALKDMKMHPLEYWLINERFVEWKALDSLMLTRLMYYSMTYDFQFELMREKMAQVVGWDLLDEVITNRESQFTWGTHAYILNDDELEQSGLLAKEHESAPKQTHERPGQAKPETKQVDPGTRKNEEPNEKKGQRTGQRTGQRAGQRAGERAEQEKKKLPKGKDFVSENYGSNCWAVHGNHTESGGPMLMGDPHLANTIPGQWIINYLQVNGSYAFGSAVPGFPGVYVGKMSAAAWSITNMGADVADLFYEKIRGNEYFYNGTWHKLKERKEMIQVKGGEPVELIVHSTGHGPLVHEYIDVVNHVFLGKIEWDESRPISLQWAALEHPIDKFEYGTYFAFPEQINTGEKIVKITQDDYTGFQVSMCFAAANGDIGYVGAVNHPIRGASSHHHINEGWDPKNDWKGYMSDDVLPYVINPKKGFVSSSNQRLASDKMHFPFANNMGPMARAVTQHNTIESYIKKGNKITVQDMQALQSSVHDSFAEQALPFMLSILSHQIHHKYSHSIKSLEAWNLEADEKSISASIFYVWEVSILATLFDDYQFEYGLEEKLSYFRNFMWESWLIGQYREWAQGKNTQSLICGKSVIEPEGNCVLLIRNAFEEAHSILARKLGDDRRLWEWGQLHRMHFEHALSKTPFRPFFHKSNPSSGGRRTVSVADYYVNEKFSFDGIHSANLRVLVDLGGDSFWSLDLGNSGIKGSEHYEDLRGQHKRGGYVKMEHIDREH